MPEKQLLRLTDVLDLLDDLERPTDFWYDAYCSEISENGFIPKAMSPDDRRLLSKSEFRDHEEFLRNLRLDLPCTPVELISWAERCGFSAVLPNNYIEQHQHSQTMDINDSNTYHSATKLKSSKATPPSTPKRRELTQWLLETWIKEGEQKGNAFFLRLKKYVGEKGSPITQHYSAGNNAGISWITSAGTRGDMKKKTILNIVSKFKSAS
jgi:hypothetical protein